MAVEIHEIGAEALGDRAATAWADRVVAAAQALAERDATCAPWVAPLLRAVERGQLKLPALSATTQRVVRLIERSEVDLDELAEAVNGDPALAARIMGVANSSYFRGVTAVSNVREALMRMGIREARTLVVVVALRGTMLRSQSLGARAQRLWSHALLSASATQEIAQAVPPWETLGFLAGLLHDLGELVVLADLAESEAYREIDDEPPEQVVSAMIDATHAPLGAMVLASWGFPEALCEAVACHPLPAEASPEARSLAELMQLGDRIAETIEAGWPADVEELPSGFVEEAAALGLDEVDLADVAVEAEASFQALSKLA